MKKVKFIKSLVVEELPLTSDNITYHSLDATPVLYKDEYHMLATNVETKVVPIHIINQFNYEKHQVEEVFIAYSEEVEDLLHMPFKCITESRDMALNSYSKLLHKVNKANWIKRLKYLFTRKLV